MTGAEIGASSLVSAALTGLSTIYQMSEQNKAAKRQQQHVANAEQIASQKAAEARARTLASAERYRPEAREQGLQEVETGLREAFEQGQADASPAPVSTLGATSGAYKGAVQSQQASGAERAGRLNTLFARTLAPGRQAVREGIGDAQNANEVGSLFGSARSAMNAGAADASRVTPSGLGTVVGGVGRGLAGGLATGKIKLPSIFTIPKAGAGASPYMLPQE